jgi:hypothetical protein
MPESGRVAWALVAGLAEAAVVIVDPYRFVRSVIRSGTAGRGLRDQQCACLAGGCRSWFAARAAAN